MAGKLFLEELTIPVKLNTKQAPTAASRHSKVRSMKLLKPDVKLIALIPCSLKQILPQTNTSLATDITSFIGGIQKCQRRTPEGERKSEHISQSNSPVEGNDALDLLIGLR